MPALVEGLAALCKYLPSGLTAHLQTCVDADEREWWEWAAAVSDTTAGELRKFGVPYPELFIVGPREENGTPAHCNPATYGEIPPPSMKTLLDNARPHAGGKFLDIGSGMGLFTNYACKFGGFKSCVGVEMMPQRMDVAKAIQGGTDTPGVDFIEDYVTKHPEAFQDVDVAYWNNLCFLPDVTKRVAKMFVSGAKDGSELYTLAELPRTYGLQQMGQPVKLQMTWEDEPYRIYKYVAHPDVVGTGTPPLSRSGKGLVDAPESPAVANGDGASFL